MSRPLRLEYPGAWYHVMNRGRRKENIFEGKQDRDLFLALLREAAQLWDVKVSAYCLMDNHYHILLQTPLGNLSRFMRHLNGVYTQRFNRRHGYDGQLFRGRYKSILIGGESHLLELVRYIHNNPVRAGLVRYPGKYRWSSHQGFLSSSETWSWLHKDDLLAMLDPNPGSRPAAYRKFMGAEENEKTVALLERKKWPSILGGDDFISWVKKKFFKKKKNRVVPESRDLAPDRDQIIRSVCRGFGVERENVMRVRRGYINDARDAALYLCRILRNDTLKELAAAFNMSGYAPAGRAVDRFRQRSAANRELQRRLDKIQDDLLMEKVSR